MPQDQFVPMFDSSLQILGRASNARANRQIIKQTDASEPHTVRRFNPENLADLESTINVIEKNGDVHGVEVKCGCGRSTCIRLVSQADESYIE